MSISKNILRYSVGWVEGLLRQNNVFRNDCYLNSTYDLRIKNLLGNWLVGSTDENF